MTKEEAIQMIEHDMKIHHDYLSGTYRTALNMAIEALKRDDPEVEFQKRSERSTYCGYTLKELLMFADACRRQGITEDKLYVFWASAESAFNYIMEKITEDAMKSIERTLS